ncbi:MAG: hypothetical protein K0Q46_2517 [Rhodococcus erythropolis]|nr:hypothetical protein [Rhodococcus erythropolis]MDF2895731.1 hypothetical protein [Rhodococcus erythropolis]
MTIATRKPTGKPSWPLLLAAGGEGAGKSFLAAQASASELVGRTLWVGHGEQDPDEYALIPGADFDIVEYDGTITGLRKIIHEAAAEPKGDKPTLIVVDSGTKVWDTISENAQVDANQRAARKGNRGGDSTIGVDIWNKHKAHWRDIIDVLRLHDGPAIITARYEEVAAMGKDPRTGRTVPTGDKVWKVKAEKGLPYDVDAVIHMPVRGQYTLSKVRSVRLQLDEPKDWPNFTMDAFWRALGLADVETGRSAYATPVVEETQEPDESGRDWLAELNDAQGDKDAIAALGAAAKAAHASDNVLTVIRSAYRDA